MSRDRPGWPPVPSDERRPAWLRSVSPTPSIANDVSRADRTEALGFDRERATPSNGAEHVDGLQQAADDGSPPGAASGPQGAWSATGERWEAYEPTIAFGADTLGHAGPGGDLADRQTWAAAGGAVPPPTPPPSRRTTALRVGALGVGALAFGLGLGAVLSRLGSGGGDAFAPPDLTTSTTAVASTSTAPPVTTAPVTLPTTTSTTEAPTTTTRPTTTTTQSTTTTAPPLIGSDWGPDLGITGYAHTPPPCEGGYGVIVRSRLASEPPVAQVIEEGLRRHPGSQYVRTDQGCGAFTPEARGSLVYYVYVGPFATLDEACARKAQADAVEPQPGPEKDHWVVPFADDGRPLGCPSPPPSEALTQARP